MTLEEFRGILEQSGFPVAYHSFPEKEVPPMPYLIYITPYSRNFKADGKVYSSSMHIQVELYTQFKIYRLRQKWRKHWRSFILAKLRQELKMKIAMRSYMNWRSKDVK